MNNENRLRLAFRDLCGWKVGMRMKPRHVSSRGGTVVQVNRASGAVDDLRVFNDEDGSLYWWSAKSTDGLPDLDSTTNAAHWIEWATEHCPSALTHDIYVLADLMKAFVLELDQDRLPDSVQKWAAAAGVSCE